VDAHDAEGDGAPLASAMNVLAKKKADLEARKRELNQTIAKGQAGVLAHAEPEPEPELEPDPNLQSEVATPSIRSVRSAKVRNPVFTPKRSVYACMDAWLDSVDRACGSIESESNSLYFFRPCTADYGYGPCSPRSQRRRSHEGVCDPPACTVSFRSCA
jgi:hypothetical protein